MNFDLRKLQDHPKTEWKKILRNDFQSGAVSRHALIQNHIERFYEQGAFYAAMSRSGSAVFGLFD
jgi:4-diphosphocytidyl-2-C-methyl-D-erythritol kinase